jgi:hypothetical protein
MTVWLVAEDRVQIIRADSVISFAVNSVKPTGSEHHDPLERLGWTQLQIRAATSATRNVESVWTSLVTLEANAQEAVKILTDLTEAIEQAEQQSSRGNKTLFIHGPLPRFNGNPEKDQVWHISEELPTKKWPTSGTYFKDPLP